MVCKNCNYLFKKLDSQDYYCQYPHIINWRIKWVIRLQKYLQVHVDNLCSYILRKDKLWIANRPHHPISELTFKLYKTLNDIEYFIRGRPNWDQWDEQNKECKQFKKGRVIK